jgi:hypothetical protein
MQSAYINNSSARRHEMNPFAPRNHHIVATTGRA